MIQVTTVKVPCPYCRHLNKTEAHSYPMWSTIFCDKSEGGCDGLFVYKVEVEPHVFTRKIEGEGE